MGRQEKHPLKAIGLKRAIELMRLPNTRLVRMVTDGSPDGFAHYVVPGGYVEPSTADKIKARPDVVAGNDGLFPGHDQTWRVMANVE